MKREEYERVLRAALETGGDFAEIFFEDTQRNSLEYRDGRVDTVQCGRDVGAAVRVLRGLNHTYAYTNDISEQGLLAAAHSAAAAIDAPAAATVQGLCLRPAREMQPAQVRPSAKHARVRAQIAQEAYRAAREISPEIVQANVTLMDVMQHVTIVNSEGVYVEDDRARSRFIISAVASANGEMQTASEGPGAGRGFEFFSMIDPQAIAQKTAQSAICMLHAPFAPAGVMPVAVGNAFGGVIFHEACGHSLESAAVSKNQSEFAGKMGQQIAHPKVTAIDDGTMLGYWGSSGYDDEGTPTKRNVLIAHGVLQSYMIDRIGARRMGSEPTGNGRRQSYRFAPTSRMTNTFIAPGEDENIIESMPMGLYAKKMGGGSVNPLTGEFNFAVQEGYLIKDGTIDRPVRGATLIGKGSEILQRIDMVGKDLALGEGMCGAASGSIPTCVGQPLIRVSAILVGGRD